MLVPLKLLPVSRFVRLIFVVLVRELIIMLVLLKLLSVSRFVRLFVVVVSVLKLVPLNLVCVYRFVRLFLGNSDFQVVFFNKGACDIISLNSCLLSLVVFHCSHFSII